MPINLWLFLTIASQILLTILGSPWSLVTFEPMKWFYVLVVLCFYGCKEGQKEEKATPVLAQNQQPYTEVNFEQFETLLQNERSPLLVVNFWATWCKPCVKELPYFEQIGKKYTPEEAQVILVSLDFPEQQERLVNFIEKHQLQSKIVFLNDGNANKWIPKVDETWSGAIPATLFISEADRRFIEGSMTYEQIDEEIKKVL